jgi:hypothetical protein
MREGSDHEDGRGEKFNEDGRGEKLIMRTGAERSSEENLREKGSFIHNAKHAKGTQQSKTLGSRLGSLY